MAMAALRSAAGRRLTGARPVVLPALRSAPLGFGRPNLTQTQGLASHGREEPSRDILEQIQEKKEKLYDLILRHGYKRDDGSICLSNIQLMHHLSAHVKPKPESIACPVVSAYAIWNIYVHRTTNAE